MDTLVKQIIGLREHDEEEEEGSAKKLDQSVVVYLTPQEINNDAGAHCGGCTFFISESSECMLTQPAKCNAEHGVCSLFLGRQQESKVIKGSPAGLISKESVGYIENAPTRCSTCEYWGGKTKEDPDADPQEKAICERVKGTIQAGGCCNKWEEC